MRVIYTALSYAPELVTGRYVRVVSGKKGVFRVYETATGTGRFKGRPGMGPTLREYETDGAEIPEDVRNRALAARTTIPWGDGSNLGEVG